MGIVKRALVLTGVGAAGAILLNRLRGSSEAGSPDSMLDSLNPRGGEKSVASTIGKLIAGLGKGVAHLWQIIQGDQAGGAAANAGSPASSAQAPQANAGEGERKGDGGAVGEAMTTGQGRGAPESAQGSNRVFDVSDSAPYELIGRTTPAGSGTEATEGEWTIAVPPFRPLNEGESVGRDEELGWTKERLGGDAGNSTFALTTALLNHLRDQIRENENEGPVSISIPVEGAGKLSAAETAEGLHERQIYRDVFKASLEQALGEIELLPASVELFSAPVGAFYRICLNRE